MQGLHMPAPSPNQPHILANSKSLAEGPPHVNINPAFSTFFFFKNLLRFILYDIMFIYLD